MRAGIRDRQADLLNDLEASLVAATSPGRSRRRGRGWLVRRLLLAADLAGLLSAFVVTEAVAGDRGGGLGGLAELAVFLLVLPLWVLQAKLLGLYDRDEERADYSTGEDLVGVFNTISVGVWAFVVVALTTGLAGVNLPKLVIFWALAVVLVPAARAAVRVISRRRPAYVQRTVIVGSGEVAQVIVRKILRHPEYGLELVGFVDTDPLELSPDLAFLPVLGALNELPELIDRHDVERIVLAFSAQPDEYVLRVLRACRDLPVQTDVVPRLFELVGPGAPVHALGGLSLIGLRQAALPRSSQLVKRLTDIVLSAAALIALTPLLVLIAIAVRLDSRGPLFFRQIRMGANDRPFTIYKFRTMVADADSRKPDLQHLNLYGLTNGDTRMFKARNDPRITRAGRSLRRFSLDELPQLINVLRGEMSMVGPRPLVLDEDQYVADWGRRRLTLKPGITGAWQVLGRNDIPFDEMVTLDYLYVTNWSMMRDIALMIRTVPVMIRARDAY